MSFRYSYIGDSSKALRSIVSIVSTEKSRYISQQSQSRPSPYSHATPQRKFAVQAIPSQKRATLVAESRHRPVTELQAGQTPHFVHKPSARRIHTLAVNRRTRKHKPAIRRNPFALLTRRTRKSPGLSATDRSVNSPDSRQAAANVPHKRLNSPVECVSTPSTECSHHAPVTPHAEAKHEKEFVTADRGTFTLNGESSARPSQLSPPRVSPSLTIDQPARVNDDSHQDFAQFFSTAFFDDG